MNRRELMRRTGAVTAVGAATSVAGCGILGGCGPGETKIETLAEEAKQSDSESESDGNESEDGTGTEEFPRVKGTIKSVEQNEIIIDDGTGRASLQTLSGGFQTQNVGSGDCAYAEGVPLEPDSSTDADVTIVVTEIGLPEDD